MENIKSIESIENLDNEFITIYSCNLSSIDEKLESFKVSRKVAGISDVIINSYNEKENEEIPVNLPPEILRLIVKYLNIKNGDNICLPIRSVEVQSIEELQISNQEKDFVNSLDESLLHELIGAADYLAINPLLNLLSIHLSIILRTKLVER